MRTVVKVILDYDGTLTVEEAMVDELARRSLDTLSREILRVPRAQLGEDYLRTREFILSQPHRFGWEVRGLLASYADEGAFILNTTTIQVMLKQNPAYTLRVGETFKEVEYDPFVDCTNYLFHRHTAEIKPRWREGAQEVLTDLQRRPWVMPLILTNSRGDKVRRHLKASRLEGVRVLGDTRQYDMDPSWKRYFLHPRQGRVQSLKVDEYHRVDLRRPIYYQALWREAQGVGEMMVVGDNLSLPGALPLAMGIPFSLLLAPYTPQWCRDFVGQERGAWVLEDISSLLERVEVLG